MIKKIDIAGIQLDNYTVRESIMEMEKDMAQNVFCTVEEIMMDTLLLAEKDLRVKEALALLDHAVIAECGILDAVGQNTMQRQHEIEDHTFFRELLKRLERNHKTVFLLGETEEITEHFYEYLQEEFKNLAFAGMEAMEDCVETTDAVVNEINASTPDALLCILPSPQQEAFLADNRDKISAKLWYGIGAPEQMMQSRHRFLDFFRRRSKIRILEKTIHHYQRQEEVG
jgi:N-acetylglucosaminyldiphosphoundecaprenol N-acetyl-beta-D-mannosaminyltransferase